MSYSGANQARQARESLGHALAALQQDPDIPAEVMDVAQNIAQAVGALFQAERAAADTDGKQSVRAALGFLSQTLVLLQDVRHQHRGIAVATEAIAGVMGVLYPLTTVPSRVPPAPAAPAASPQVHIPQAAPIPLGQPTMFGAPAVQGPAQPAFQPPPAQAQPYPSQSAFAQPPAPAQPVYVQPPAQAQPVYAQPPAQAQPAKPQPAPTPVAFTQPAAQLTEAAQAARAHAPVVAPAPTPAPIPLGGTPVQLEANVGASTESNFYVGFSGEIADGGVFVATYESLPKGTPVHLLVTLPGGFDFRCQGYVRFVRDPMDFASDSEPGMGIQFAPSALSSEARGLIQRFIQKRAPIFYDE